MPKLATASKFRNSPSKNFPPILKVFQIVSCKLVFYQDFNKYFNIFINYSENKFTRVFSKVSLMKGRRDPLQKIGFKLY